MEKININEIKSNFKICLHIAIEHTLKSPDKKCIFATSGNSDDLIKYLKKYSELYKIWIRSCYRKEDGMSRSIGGYFELIIFYKKNNIKRNIFN